MTAKCSPENNDDAGSPINVMIGTAGHIDHGKTALVRLLTGCDTDTLREERERGMSINLGFAPCMLDSHHRVGIVDVPGHEKFIRNMVAGVTGIDIVLLVIAADDGVMPQTVEHLHIVELLGISRGLVVLTKIDLVDEGIVELATEEIHELLEGTFLADAPVVPFSSATGEGFDGLWDAVNELVDGTKPRDVGGVFRMPVERVFSIQGYGTVATGIPTSGRVKLGETLELLPGGRTGRVRGIQVYGTDSKESQAGQCTALNISGLSRADVERGYVFATPGYFHPVDIVEARLRILPDKATPLKHNERLRLHTGTSETLCRLSLLDHEVIMPGEDGLVQFRLESPVVVGANDRFVVRSFSPPRTIGGGIIISTSGRRIRRSRTGEVEALALSERALTDEESNMEHVLLASGEKPLDMDALAKGAACTAERARELVDGLVASGRAITLAGGSRFVHDSPFESVKQRAARMLGHFHAEQPLRFAEDRPRLRDRTASDPHVFDGAVDALIADGIVEKDFGGLKLVAHKVSLTKKQQKAARAIEKLYLDTDLGTPRPDQLADQIDAPKAVILEMLDMLCESGVLIRPEPRVVFHGKTVDRVKQILIDTITENGAVETAAFRDLLGTSKKYTMALLDHFESTQLTIRVKSEHRLKPK